MFASTSNNWLASSRNQFINQGSESLELEQLLALILGNIKSADRLRELCVAIGNRLRFGQRGLADLLEIEGAGLNSASAVLAAIRLGEVLELKRQDLNLYGPEMVYQACCDLLEKPQEHLVIFYLTARQQAVAREIVSVGTLTATIIHAREVFRTAIKQNSAQIIIAHNHPSGDCQASQPDREVTIQMVQAGKLIGIEVVDHVICGIREYYSFKERCPEMF